MSGRNLSTSLAMIVALLPTLALAAGGDSALQPSVVTDGPVKVSVSIDRNVAQVAEPIQLVLAVEAPRGTRVELPQLTDQLGDFEIRSHERTKDIPAADGANARRWVLEASLETIKTGELVIPPLGV